MPEKTTEEYHPAPKWLTNSYIEDKLQKLFKDESIKVTNLDITPANAKGENYASVMTRIKVSYNTSGSQNIHNGTYLVKTTFEGNSPSSHVMNSYGIYEREMEMYQKILPKLSKLLHSIGDKDKLFANTIYVDHDYSAIIFEDLSESNFVMADRLACLDMNHIRIALKKLAKMHATAAVLSEQEPNLFKQNYDRGIFNRHTDAFKPMVCGVLAALTRYVKSNEQLNEKYYEKLRLLQTNIMEFGARVFDPVKHHFNTLVHGDFWTNNMLFKYDNSSNDLVDVIPIDFQFSTWASPAVDLHYLFNTSLRHELRLNNQNELLQYYYHILASTLKALSFKGHVPSLHEFYLQFEMRSFYGLFSALIFQPIMLCESSEDSEFNNLISDSESGIRFKDAFFKNPIIQKNVESLLPLFDQKGLLDILIQDKRS